MVDKWLKDDPKHSFATWKARLPKERKQSTSSGHGVTKEEVRAYYLAEKYWRKWRMNLGMKKHRIVKLSLNDSRWLETIMFNPISRLARHVTCSIIELMCNTHERRKEVTLSFSIQMSKLHVCCLLRVAVNQQYIFRGEKI